MTELVPPIFTSRAEEGSDPALLPRLLYVGDVRVESTLAGMALLFRLLQNYPSANLRIVESNLFDVHPDRRLTGIGYECMPVPLKRLLFTRFNRAMSLCVWLASVRRARRLRRIVEDFRPEAVLTVAHGFSWLTAARLAENLQLPLHLIVHDEVVESCALPAFFAGCAHRKFGQVYRHAASRLCISPYMVELYERQYGARGSVLLPLRAADCPRFDSPPRRSSKRGLTFAFAGSLAVTGYIEGIVAVARAIEPLEGRFLVYTNETPDTLARLGLKSPNVLIRSTVPFKRLVSELREEADVLFVPMTFDEGARRNMEVSFPSKLADYTSVGLPLLIFGPPYCSAVRWARQNLGVAEVIDKWDEDLLANAVRNLNASATYRFNLGARALEVGNRDFGHHEVVHEFYRILRSSSASILSRAE